MIGILLTFLDGVSHSIVIPILDINNLRVVEKVNKDVVNDDACFISSYWFDFIKGVKSIVT